MKYLYTIILVLIINVSVAYSWAECDSVWQLRQCLGNALTLETTHGKGADYLDVYKSADFNKVDREFTFELWMKLERVPNTKQFIAGIWGPNTDRNDQWVVYISTNDELVFELSSPNSDMESLDNTIVKIDSKPLEDTWNHLSFKFDGYAQKAYIYMNGFPQDSSTNTQYPITRLRKLANPEMSMQIASCNGLRDSSQHRTFSGQMDEIRYWARALSDDEILCQKDKALYGTEDSLMIYYRCNQTPDEKVMCDATDRGHFASMYNGASCQKSDRTYTQTLFTDITEIKDTLWCDTEKTYTFSVVDTSICGNRFYVRAYRGRLQDFVSLPQYNIYLDQNVPKEVSITVNSEYVGDIKTTIQVISHNWCRRIINIPVNITRITELSYSLDTLEYGKLIANCSDEPFRDTVITICNRTKQMGNPRSITITDFTQDMPNVFSPDRSDLPITIPVDSCYDLRVRFYSHDTTALYLDTLRIKSTDKCLGSGVIPLSGTVEEVIGIITPDGERLDTIDFKTICVDYASNAFNWHWENLIDEDIFVEDIIVPEHFISKSFKFNVLLAPETGYKANYFRFLPEDRGDFLDSIMIVVNARGCRVYRPVYVKGTGFYADVDFVEESIEFGDVIVGQSVTRQVEVENKSKETLSLSFYLRKGESFFLTGAWKFSISPGQTKTLDLTFIPLEGIDYYDELCLYEQKCFTSKCIPIHGRGVIEKFSFEPERLEILNVIGCRDKIANTKLINNISLPVNIKNLTLDDPNGKFTIVSPNPLPNSLTLNENEEYNFQIRYTPNDVSIERADRAYIRFLTEDGEEWSIKLYGTSVIPKFYVTDLSAYGVVEVGDRERDTITIENISSIDVIVDSITVGQDFELIYPSTGYLGRTVSPRDSIQAIVDFVPTQEKLYKEDITVWTSDPCESIKSGELNGQGIIIPMEVPLTVLSYGYIDPCDCEIRKIELLNRSIVHEMTVDSIWIDDQGLTDANPEYFSWASHLNPSGTLPYSIPAKTKDSLFVKYCPRSEAIRSVVSHEALLHVKSHGVAWEKEYESFLAGRQSIIMEPMPTYLEFQSTMVDTFSAPRYGYLTIPDVDVNPDRRMIRIDTITFEPNERVFYAADSTIWQFPPDSNFKKYPIYIDIDSIKNIRFDFKPRAVREYWARANIHISEPCSYVDTTILLYGNSFAQYCGVSFNFDTNSVKLDTFKFITCDTLEIPIYTSIDIPAEIVDIKTFLKYDTTSLELIDAESYYVDNPGPDYPPYINIAENPYNPGNEILLKNFWKIDDQKEFVKLKFLSKNLKRDTLKIEIDSVAFDTEEVILCHIIAERDSCLVIIQEPEFTILDTISFDSTRVLDCKIDTIRVVNIGDTELKINEILDLNNNLKLIDQIPSKDESIAIGDTTYLIIEFCPEDELDFFELYDIYSNYPCELVSNTSIDGISYIPEKYYMFDVSTDFDTQDTLNAQIGDTLRTSIYIDNNLNDTLNNIDYWYTDFDFKLYIAYDKRTLKYLNYHSNYQDIDLNYKHGILEFNYSNIDSLKVGNVLDLEFLVTVPDKKESKIFISADNFKTNWIPFIKPIVTSTNALFISEEKCKIDSLNFHDFGIEILDPYPNPANELVEININSELSNSGKLSLSAINGELLEERDINITTGNNIFSIDLTAYNSGLYVLEIIVTNRKEHFPIIIIK